MSKNEQGTSDLSSLHRYRTEIPNIIDEMDLSVYAFRLYVKLKRVAGDGGKCFYSTRQLAEQCRMSVGSISNAKQELIEKELIRVDSGGEWARDNITIIDMWPANFAYFAREQSPPACSPHEQSEHESVHHVNKPVHDMNAPVHHMNTKEELYKEEPFKEERNEQMNESSSLIHLPEQIELDDCIDLLTAPEVGLDKSTARRLATGASFDLLLRHIFAWLAHRDSGGKYGTTGALIKRIKSNFSAPALTAEQKRSDLFMQFHALDYASGDYRRTHRDYSEAAE